MKVEWQKGCRANVEGNIGGGQPQRTFSDQSENIFIMFTVRRINGLYEKFKN